MGVAGPFEPIESRLLSVTRVDEYRTNRASDGTPRWRRDGGRPCSFSPCVPSLGRCAGRRGRSRGRCRRPRRCRFRHPGPVRHGVRPVRRAVQSVGQRRARHHAGQRQRTRGCPVRGGRHRRGLALPPCSSRRHLPTPSRSPTWPMATSPCRCGSTVSTQVVRATIDCDLPRLTSPLEAQAVSGAAPVRTAELPRTGADIGGFIIGGVLVSAGIAASLLARRRYS